MSISDREKRLVEDIALYTAVMKERVVDGTIPCDYAMYRACVKALLEQAIKLATVAAESRETPK